MSVIRLLLRHRSPPLLRRSFSCKPLSPPKALPPPPSPLLRPDGPSLPPLSLLPPHRRSFPFYLVLVSGTLVSALTTGAIVYSPLFDREAVRRTYDVAYQDFERAADRSRESLRRITAGMRQTGVAATVLWRSLASVLSSANHEVKKGFELRVAALVADIAAANEARRMAIVEAGKGAVVDWLLEKVAVGGGKKTGECNGTQAESARALAYLIADQNVCDKVLGRPQAVPNLLRFIFSFQPKQAKKHKHSSLDGSDVFKGRSMLIAAIMDIITSNCDDIDQASFHPSLPPNAEIGDIAAAIEVIQEGGMHFNEEHTDDDDGDSGIQGIGIKVIGGTTILGFSREENFLRLEDDMSQSCKYVPSGIVFQRKYYGSSEVHHLASPTVPGLWDDLQREHVAVPFAAWALANWASASEFNRSHINELDNNGHAVLTALTAPERTVKWHGNLMARALLEDKNLPLTDSVADWCFNLLCTVLQSSKNDDIPLASAALSAFYVSVKRSDNSKMIVIEKGLHLMREAAKLTDKHGHMQETLSSALELLYSSDMHLSLEESQKWAGILLRWVFNKLYSDSTCSSAINIISNILEDYGPASIPISQGWLTILLTEMLQGSKLKEKSTFKSDKVQSQIDQSNAVLAYQTSNQLAAAVVNLTTNQFQQEESGDPYPLSDFLSLEPFNVVYKNVKKDKLQKIDAADSAIATLKGIKALTELCTGDSSCQNTIVDLGIFCLLRRFILADDYEKLAANETYNASRILKPQGLKPNGSGLADVATDSSSVRVPPTTHIRRHAARLLMILSFLPKVKKAIVMDQELCKWLENCASGMISCCNDHKIQSYCRATLLNAFCFDQGGKKASGTGIQTQKECPRFSDMIFLINPELQHWKTGREKGNSGQDPIGYSESALQSKSTSSQCNKFTGQDNGSSSASADNPMDPMTPLIDVIFVHGLRGGPFNSWRIAENKSSTTSKAGLVENIDQEAGKQGTCWPREWLSTDFPQARLFTIKYKTNLSQWTGATLPLQEVSSMLLQKLVDAGIGDRPVVFVTHSMGGLVVKQMLYEAKLQNISKFVNQTIGIVFYSCPHFGSKLADMPWHMGLVLRPAPSIGELRSGSPRLMELNEFLRQRCSKGLLKVLSFSETQVTPIVEGYGGWAFRMEIVPIESAYPGFGDIIVLDATDHINSCKPVSRTDPSYAKTLDFLRKLKESIR